MREGERENKDEEYKEEKDKGKKGRKIRKKIIIDDNGRIGERECGLTEQEKGRGEVNKNEKEIKKGGGGKMLAT